MIISNSKKFIFIHIHKCAGTSISKGLEPILSDDDIKIFNTATPTDFRKHRLQLKLGKHSPAKDIRNFVGEKKWNEYYKFAFVRHPVLRMTSLYKFAHRTVTRNIKNKKGPKKHLKWSIVKAYLGTDNFSDFIRHPALVNAVGARPQFESLSIDGELDINYIGKVEAIVDDFKTITDLLGIKDCVLKQLNRSSNINNDRKLMITGSDKKYLYKKYKIDFDHFGYEL